MGEPPDRKKQGYCASVAGKASFPGHENLEEALPGTEIVVRLIEDAMAQAGSHDGGNQHRAEQRVEKRGRGSFPLEEPLEKIPAQHETEGEKKSIPADFEGTYVEEYGIDLPVHEKEIHNKGAGG